MADQSCSGMMDEEAGEDMNQAKKVEAEVGAPGEPTGATLPAAGPAVGDMGVPAVAGPAEAAGPAAKLRLPGMVASLRHGQFRALMSFSLIHHIGWWMRMMTMNWLIVELTHSKKLLGTVVLAMSMGALVVLPFGGPLADRVNRRRLLAMTFVLGGVYTLGAAALAWHDMLGAWHIIGLALLIGLTNGVRFPAYNSMITGIVDRKVLPNAVALNTLQFQISRVIGPALAGVIYVGFTLPLFALKVPGGAANLIVCAATCLIMAGALGMMRDPRQSPPSGRSMAGDLVKGFGYLHTRRDLTTLMLLASAGATATTPLIILLPAYVDETLHLGVAHYGKLLSFMGIGAVLGSVHQTVVSRDKHSPQSVYGYLLLLAGAAIAAGFCHSYWQLVPIMVIVGACQTGIVVVTKSVIFTTSPNEYQGRMSSYFTICMHVPGPIGAFAAGFAAERFGVTNVWVTFGVLLLLFVPLVGAFGPSLGVHSQQVVSEGA